MSPSEMNGTTVVEGMKVKPKVFIIFADLDGTFTPIDIEGLIDFVEVVKEIQEQSDVKVKFCPISGRPCGYVLRVLHETRDALLSYNITDVCEFGAAEQGALLVDASRSYGPKYLGEAQNRGLKAKIAEILKNSQYRKILADEPDKLYTCSIHIKNEYKASMTHAEQFAVYSSIRDDIHKQYGPDAFDISMSHNCMEVMSKEISKAFAVNMLIYSYMHAYNVVGIIYAGDAENDKVAIKYVSRLAEVPGMNAHVFIPSNSNPAIFSEQLEGWKKKFGAASRMRITKGSEKLFRGITSQIRYALKAQLLFGPGATVWETRDDLALLEMTQHQKWELEPLERVLQRHDTIGSRPVFVRRISQKDTVESAILRKLEEMGVKGVKDKRHEDWFYHSRYKARIKPTLAVANPSTNHSAQRKMSIF